MNTQKLINKALIQQTSRMIVEELVKNGIRGHDLSDEQRGVIVSQWLTEGDNISDAGEVYDGISEDALKAFYAAMVRGENHLSSNVWITAVGQAPYSETILSGLEQKARDHFDEIARGRFEPDDFDAAKARGEKV